MMTILSNCATTTTRQYDFSLKSTLSIFMLNNEKGPFFCIPVQYMGDYHIGGFDYTRGLIVIGGYEIPLKRDAITISAYLREETDEAGSLDSGFDLVYLEEKGEILLSKMREPLTVKQVEGDGKYAHYYIFIERFLSDSEVKKINNEYKRGNINSRLEIWYDLIIDDEMQDGNGMLDDFELYDGIAVDPAYYPPNLNFFKTKYMQK